MEAEEPLQGGRRGLRRPGRRRETLPSTTASATPASRAGAAGSGAGVNPTSSRTSATSSRPSGTSSASAACSAARARRSGPQRGRHLRFDLAHRVRRGLHRQREDDPDAARRETCDTCNGTGSATGAAPDICPQCHGRRPIRFQQGFFTSPRPCGQCGGTGRIVTNPCRRAAARVAPRRIAGPAPELRHKFRPASQPASGSAWHSEGNTEAGRPDRAISTSWCTCAHPRVPSPRGDDLLHRDTGRFPLIVARRPVRGRRARRPR